MKPGTYLTNDGEIETVFFKTPYNHDTDAEAKRTGLECLDKSLTQQQFKEECDINTIVKNFKVTGNLPLTNLPPLQDDFDSDEIFDFQSAMNMVIQAKQSFAGMAAEVRDAFNHDPQRYVSQVDAWIKEPDKERREMNLSVMRAMGLAVQPGPKADTTTLGDVLKAIKESGRQGGPPAPPADKQGAPAP